MVTYHERQNGGEIVFALSGNLVAGSFDDLRTKVKSTIGENSMALIFDLTEVASVDSAGIGFIAATFNSISKIKGSLKVIGLSEDMHRFFVALRLNAHFPVEMRKL